MERLHANEVGMMPSLGGRLYPDVRSTLEALKPLRIAAYTLARRRDCSSAPRRFISS